MWVFVDNIYISINKFYIQHTTFVYRFVKCLSKQNKQTNKQTRIFVKELKH
jgi:predicted metalloprotease